MIVLEKRVVYGDLKNWEEFSKEEKKEGEKIFVTPNHYGIFEDSEKYTLLIYCEDGSCFPAHTFRNFIPSYNHNLLRSDEEVKKMDSEIKEFVFGKKFEITVTTKIIQVSEDKYRIFDTYLATSYA